ncbi:hypothetical protein [Nocardioides sp.]|uniref:hypothetical protein n=1 Tax=Nocardioides sp. TaxID=35761 RepID=UPI00286B6581|nr:hypothetical protein [Nocardioides sp.]
MPDIPLTFALVWLILGLAAVTAVLVRRRLKRSRSRRVAGTGQHHHEHPRIH